MENVMEQIWLKMTEYVSFEYLVTFVFLSYLIKRYFSGLLAKLFKKPVPMVYVVLIIATILAIPFNLGAGVPWVKILISYAVGTSLHELAFQWIEKKFQK